MRFLPGVALDPGRVRHRHRHAARHAAAHGRLQARPDADRRAGHRPAGARRGGERRGVHLLLSDSTNAEDPGSRRASAASGPVLYDIVRDAPATRGGGLLLQPHPPDPAGRGRGAAAERGRGVPRPGHAPERRRGARDRPPARRRRRTSSRSRTSSDLDPRPGGGVLHRFAGRAALGAVPDGRARAQVGEAPAGRHGRAVVLGRSPATRRPSTGSSTGCTAPAPTCTTCRPTRCTSPATPRRRSSGSCCPWSGPAGSSRSTASSGTSQHHARLAEEVGIPRRAGSDLRGRRRRRGRRAGPRGRPGPGRDDVRRRAGDRRRGRGGAPRPPQARRRRGRGRGRHGGHAHGRGRGRPGRRQPRVRLRGDLRRHP